MKNNIITLIVAIAISWALILFYQKPSETSHHKETAYERVIRTGVLRCAYGTWEPSVMRDPNTGQMSGLMYDFMQDVGKALNIKVEYTLEVPWDSIANALETGKADAHCAGIWATPARGRSLAFTEPMFFSPTVAYVRKDDNRFDNNIERANQPDITIALSDDDITTELYHHDFPNAKSIELPQMAPPEELLLAVATKKADITFNGATRYATFEKSNPGQIKIVPLAKPLRIFPDVVAVDIHENELLHMLNTAIDAEIDNGKADKLVAKYKAKYDMGYIVPVVRPWKNSGN